MSQEQPAKSTNIKPKNKFGLIMLLSAFILGVSLFVVSQTAKNEDIDTNKLTRKVVNSVKEEAMPQKTETGYEKIEETTETPKAIDNEVLDTLDNDMKDLENTSEDLSKLDL